MSFPWIVALTVVACFALAAQADEGPALQQHSAAACGEDTQCLKLWYAEYKDAIIQEVLFWREFEDDIAAHNENAAEADLGFAIRRHQYRHNHWDFYKGDRFEGVSDRELSTLINSCRVAIIDMKFMLLPVGDGRPLAKGATTSTISARANNNLSCGNSVRICAGLKALSLSRR